MNIADDDGVQDGEDWRAGRGAKETLKTVYCTTILYAQTLYKFITDSKNERNLCPKLCEGFEGEVEKIKRVGAPLRQEVSDFSMDVLVYRFYLERLRRCYGAYAILTFTICGDSPASAWDVSGGGVENIIQGGLFGGGLLFDFNFADKELFSPLKLYWVLQQSRDCTYNLLKCTSNVVLPPAISSFWDYKNGNKAQHGLNCWLDKIQDVSNIKAPEVALFEPWELGITNTNIKFQIPTLPEGGQTRDVLVERKTHECTSDPHACGTVRPSLLDLAKQLQKLPRYDDSALLPFRGLVEMSRPPGSYAFLYEIPRRVEQGWTPSIVSLRDLINGNTFSESPQVRIREQIKPEARLRIAKPICRALANLHHNGILHRNMRKGSIIFLYDSNDLSTIYRTSPKLVDYDFPRMVGEQTSYQFAGDFESNISRHPAAQGLPSEFFSEKHDIYALGVLLLEIGLWTSAKNIFTAESKGVPPTKETSPVKIRNKLRLAAETSLMSLMGGDYALAVMACLDSYYKADGETMDLGPVSAASINAKIESIKVPGVRREVLKPLQQS